MNKYFLNFLEFDSKTINADFAADILMESFTGTDDQLDKILDVLFAEDDVDPGSGLDRLETIELTSDEMVSVTSFIKELKDSNDEAIVEIMEQSEEPQTTE